MRGLLSLLHPWMKPQLPACSISCQHSLSTACYHVFSCFNCAVSGIILHIAPSSLLNLSLLSTPMWTRVGLSFLQCCLNGPLLTGNSWRPPHETLMPFLESLPIHYVVLGCVYAGNNISLKITCGVAAKAWIECAVLSPSSLHCGPARDDYF